MHIVIIMCYIFATPAHALHTLIATHLIVKYIQYTAIYTCLTYDTNLKYIDTKKHSDSLYIILI